MSGPAAALILAAVAAAIASPTDSGQYRTSQMEMAGALELTADGRFRYALDYGAASETAEGEWSGDRDGVRLTSKPMPVQPRFVLVRDDPAPMGELYMTLEDPGFGWGGPLDAVAIFAGESQAAVISADESGRVATDGHGAVVSLQPLMPVYEAASEPVKLAGDRGHRLLFRFEANDMGKAAFRDEPLRRSGPDLVLQRFETEIRFRRVGP